MNARLFSSVLIITLPFLLAACATRAWVDQSEELMRQGRPDEAVQLLAQASRDSPSDLELRAQYYRQRDQVSAQLLAQAQAQALTGRLDEAESLYRRVQQFDPHHPRVRDGQSELAGLHRIAASVREAQVLSGKGDRGGAEKLLRGVLAQVPDHLEARRLLQALREKAPAAEPVQPVLKADYSQPVTLEFRETPLRNVFEVISRTSGINFVFDKDVRGDIKVTLFVRNTGIDEIVKLVLATNQLERKVLNENSVLIYPNVPAKVREYQELVTRTFYLTNAEVKQAQAMVRALVKTRDSFIDEKLNLLVIKDTPQAVDLAAQLIESLDQAEPEVMLDVEVLEMSRSKLQELGLRFPDQIGYGQLQSQATTTTIVNGVTQSVTTPGGALASGFVDLRNTDSLTSFVANPALTLNLRNQIGSGNTLANPRIRVKNREKAKIHIGDRLPVFTTTSTANVGVSASVSYLDVGLKLDVEPNVYLDDEVAIKVGLEVSSVVREITGPSNSLAYQIGTRNASTVLQLRNGETQVLAGLISDEERSSANRLPGLGDVPVLGRLFSSQRDSASKTEIVLLITPRVVRNVTRGELSLQPRPAGSETSIGAAPLLLRSSPARTLSLRSSGGATPAQATARPLAPIIPSEPPAPAEPEDSATGTPAAAAVPSTPTPAPEQAPAAQVEATPPQPRAQAPPAEPAPEKE